MHVRSWLKNRWVIGGLLMLCAMTVAFATVQNGRTVAQINNNGADFAAFESFCAGVGGQFVLGRGCYNGQPNTGIYMDSKGWWYRDYIIAFCQQGPCTNGVCGNGASCTNNECPIASCPAGSTTGYVGDGGYYTGLACANTYYGQQCGNTPFRPGYVNGCTMFAAYDSSGTYQPTGPNCGVGNQCTVDADCPVSTETCRVNKCVSGTCQTQIAPDGYACGTTPPSDPYGCLQNVCSSGYCVLPTTGVGGCSCTLTPGGPNAFRSRMIATVSTLSFNKPIVVATAGQCTNNDSTSCNFPDSCGKVQYTNTWSGPGCCDGGGSKTMILTADPGQNYATLNFADACNGAANGTKQVPVCPCGGSSASSAAFSNNSASSANSISSRSSLSSRSSAASSGNSNSSRSNSQSSRSSRSTSSQAANNPSSGSNSAASGNSSRFSSASGNSTSRSSQGSNQSSRSQSSQTTSGSSASSSCNLTGFTCFLGTPFCCQGQPACPSCNGTTCTQICPVPTSGSSRNSGGSVSSRTSSRISGASASSRNSANSMQSSVQSGSAGNSSGGSTSNRSGSSRSGQTSSRTSGNNSAGSDTSRSSMRSGSSLSGSAGSNGSGSSRSSISGHSQSSSNSAASVGACRGDECIRGGDLFCARSGASCITTGNLPCIQCVISNNSSTTSRSSTRTSSRTSRSSRAGDDGGDDSGDGGDDSPDIFYCGDGLVTANEECDDANAQGGDGCTAQCRIEASLGLCTGRECTEGGSDVCGSFGLQCEGTDDLPCIQCVGDDELPEDPLCTGNSCSAGGSNICNDFGMSCLEDGENPCFLCEASYASSSFGNIAVMNCSGNECNDGGHSVCNAFGLSCAASNNLPCISCVNSLQNVVQPSCAVDGCSAGGTDVCGAQNLGCVPSKTGACFVCTNKEMTMVAVASPFICGNGTVEPGEQCDDGAQNSDRMNALCRTNCRRAGCGDGILDTPLEQCDDGNTRDGDGCSMLCTRERSAPDATLPGQVIELPFSPGNAASISGGTAGSGDTSGMTPTTPVPPSAPDTGPAAIAVMAAGAAAGYSYMKRRRL